MARIASSAAPAMAAGVIYQFERALYHLAHAGPESLVGIEEIDDVLVAKSGRAGRKLTIEQDKHSLRPRGFQISDRSLAIWRTLQNWLNAWEKHGPKIEKFLFVTNHQVSNAFLKDLGEPNKSEASIKRLITALRSQPSKVVNPDSEITQVIASVCSRTDDALAAVLQRIELVETDADKDNEISVLETLHLPEGIDPNQVLIALKGWVQTVAMTCWKARKPALIARQAFSNQLHRVLGQLHRKRVRERAKRFVPVTADERDKEKSSRFVHHLAMIEADDDVVDAAIADYLMFSKEKLRLTEEGVVNEEDWLDRSDRLSDRWGRILQRARADHKGVPAPEVGRKILYSTTDHKEPLAGEDTSELYFTSGHYHRLANEDSVWWLPTFKPKKA